MSSEQGLALYLAATVTSAPTARLQRSGGTVCTVGTACAVAPASGMTHTTANRNTKNRAVNGSTESIDEAGVALRLPTTLKPLQHTTTSLQVVIVFFFDTLLGIIRHQKLFINQCRTRCIIL